MSTSAGQDHSAFNEKQDFSVDESIDFLKRLFYVYEFSFKKPNISYHSNIVTRIITNALLHGDADKFEELLESLQIGLKEAFNYAQFESSAILEVITSLMADANKNNGQQRLTFAIYLVQVMVSKLAENFVEEKTLKCYAHICLELYNAGLHKEKFVKEIIDSLVDKNRFALGLMNKINDIRDDKLLEQQSVEKNFKIDLELLRSLSFINISSEYLSYTSGLILKKNSERLSRYNLRTLYIWLAGYPGDLQQLQPLAGELFLKALSSYFEFESGDSAKLALNIAQWALSNFLIKGNVINDRKVIGAAIVMNEYINTYRKEHQELFDIIDTQLYMAISQSLSNQEQDNLDLLNTQIMSLEVSSKERFELEYKRDALINHDAFERLKQELKSEGLDVACNYWNIWTKALEEIQVSIKPGINDEVFISKLKTLFILIDIELKEGTATEKSHNDPGYNAKDNPTTSALVNILRINDSNTLDKKDAIIKGIGKYLLSRDDDRNEVIDALHRDDDYSKLFAQFLNEHDEHPLAKQLADYCDQLKTKKPMFGPKFR